MRIGLKIGSKLTLIQRAKGIYGLNRGSAGPCIPDQRIFQNSFFSFYQDFCVKKLKFCCPGRDEFGKKCKKCPVNADGTVCSGNGICVGAGDKEGPGNCKCNDHFAGWKCHECHEDYYMSKGECHKCHKSCKVSYTIIRSLQCVATIAVPDDPSVSWSMEKCQCFISDMYWTKIKALQSMCISLYSSSVIQW